MIIGLLSFGLLKQPKTPIIPLSFDADYDMEKALVFGVIAIQLIYCPLIMMTGHNTQLVTVGLRCD